jgi:hypothetical protein
MHCPRCQRENRPQAKFCEECGASLAQSCGHCEAMLSTLDDLYLLMCSDCGGTMTAPSAKINEMNCSVPSCPEEGAAEA